jgi:para-aminobenzoate synthetase / 4-amino-4-deoxychorismate lyase
MLTGAVSSPFVLLDDARAQNPAPSRLYTNPVRLIIADAQDGVSDALDAVQAATRLGLHAAGYIAYQAGLSLEPALAGMSQPSPVPLVWFGLFEGYEEIAPDQVPGRLPDPAGAWAGPPVPHLLHEDYGQALRTVKDYIEAGDIYQANLTFGCDVQIAGDPLALYAGLRARAGAGYGGIVWTGQDWFLSLSPELFFSIQDGKITTRPMKGTSARGFDADSDAQAAATLRSDPKQRAENLMIVDLLRNDLSRVAEPGSVAVPQLFSVETYPGLHQLTSTVTAKLAANQDATSVIRAIFPCGSITGAPKIRAMEIITDVESDPRGLYTGSIGRIDPCGDAAFNVAIRTLHLRDTATCATFGLGSGIVADSQIREEWDECLTKGNFVADPRRFDLIETMRFDPAGGIALLERHLARLKTSADQFGFVFDRHSARNELQAATFHIQTPRRVRLMLAPSGRIAVEISALHATPADAVDVALSTLPVAASDFRLMHKTSDRRFYTDARTQSGAFEVVFVGEDGFLTEGSFTNIFVKRDKILLTPPLSRGLLPGVLREELIARDMAVEADLRPEDLSAGFFIGNASRGLLAAKLIGQQ